MVALACYVNPPRPGDESHEAHQQERRAIISSLKQRARRMSEFFNELPGISCQLVDGSMYAFPRVFLPQLAIQEARSKGKAPDTLYCFQLLEHAGIAATPGSSFEQEDGTYHFRTTILPPEEGFQDLLQRFRAFHMHFMRTYGGMPPARASIDSWGHGATLGLTTLAMSKL